MIKHEVIEKISNYFKLTQFEAEKIYDDIFSIIMKGVKDDNVAEITNFGEFITKYNNGKNGNGSGNNSNDASNGYKKTVEFLASSGLEEELNQPVKESAKPGFEISHTTPMKNTEEVKPINGSAASPIEDEFRKKREALLNKISIHPLQDSAVDKKKYEEPVIPSFKEEEPVLPEPEIVNENLPEKTEQVEETHFEEIKDDELNGELKLVKPDETDDDVSQKSFSDYFAEVKSDIEPEQENEIAETEFIPEQHVIPQSAVELHNEITHHVEKEEPPALLPVKEELGDKVEFVNEDNSYYIWYKDSEANVNDTQTMSYEYELLYQATKEAEYKSKLKLYVSTFILFFSIVLVLLIFSPVIYKVFFSPAVQTVQPVEETTDVNSAAEEPNTQNTAPQEQVSQTQNTTPPVEENKPPVQNEQQNQAQTPPPVQQEAQQQKEQPPVTQQQPPQQEKTQTPPVQQNTDTKIAGVTKNTMGWADDKYKVIYVLLDNGKYTIQESAWDTDVKANKRISTVAGFNISGLKGSIVKADLADKGIWYRVRFGEFSTLEEARLKAEELRKKESVRFQALLACFLFLT